jgi:hypothetical protein
MPCREGEVYRCPLPECGCEVTVTSCDSPDCQGLTCCGQTMIKIDQS